VVKSRLASRKSHSRTSFRTSGLLGRETRQLNMDNKNKGMRRGDVVMHTMKEANSGTPGVEKNVKKKNHRDL